MKNASSGISKKGTKIIGIMVNDMHERDEVMCNREGIT